MFLQPQHPTSFPCLLFGKIPHSAVIREDECDRRAAVCINTTAAAAAATEPARGAVSRSVTVTVSTVGPFGFSPSQAGLAAILGWVRASGRPSIKLQWEKRRGGRRGVCIFVNVCATSACQFHEMKFYREL